jgi:hypothetical protein
MRLAPELACGSPVHDASSAVADVAGQQPAPGGRSLSGALTDRGDAVHLVDVGTGNFGGDHDSFTRLCEHPEQAAPDS